MIWKMLSFVNYLVVLVVSFTINGVLTQLSLDGPSTLNGTGGICNSTTKTLATTTSTGTNRTTTTTRKPSSTIEKVGARAAEMCKKYSEYAYLISEGPLSLINPAISKSLECTFEKEPFNIGRTNAARQEFPHMAQLGYRNEAEIYWACAGSLISKNFILAAGQCVRSSDLGDPKLVRVGITNVADTKYLQVRNVQQIIRHPNYNGEKYHDIALLKMDSNFDMNPYVRPACVYTIKTIPYQRAIATAWGKIDYIGEEDTKDLLKIVLEFFNTTQCNYTYRRAMNQPDSALAKGIVEDLMVCAGSSDQAIGTCQGAAGGPLQVYHEETDDVKCMYNIVGVISFGPPCGLVKNFPEVYTRVSAYVNWIEDNVWPR